MPARALRTPSYRPHRPTGQAVVTISGRDVYLGRHGTESGRLEYDRVIAEWLASGRSITPARSSSSTNPDRPATGMTVDELILGYCRFAEGYYRKGGEPTSEVGNVRNALRPLRRLYGTTPAAAFGPLALKVVRQAMIDSDLCRAEVNRRVGRVARAFKWAAENEFVPPFVHHGFKAVSGLRKGRSQARETEPIRPAPDPSLGVEASDDWARTTAKAERVPSSGKFVKTTRPPWPRIFIGLDVLWDSEPVRRGRCPGCRGRRLGPTMYCLLRDTWGNDGEFTGGCPELISTVKWPSTDWLQPGYMAPGRKEAIARERKERQAAKSSKDKAKAKPPGPTRKERRAAMRAKLEGRGKAG